MISQVLLILLQFKYRPNICIYLSKKNEITVKSIMPFCEIDDQLNYDIVCQHIELFGRIIIYNISALLLPSSKKNHDVI